MDKETLRKVHLVQLDMLKEIKRVCNILNITYHLDSGTLLGAVRHKGFIPWDDDLDVGMLREEYERFIREAPTVLSEKYFIQTWHNDPKYGLPFAKLRKKGTVYIEDGAKESGAETGIYVDVFPYNSYPDDVLKQKIQGLKYYVYRRLVLIKCDYSPWNSSASESKIKKYVYLLVKLLVMGFSKEFFVKQYEKICFKYNDLRTGLVFPSGVTNYGEWIVKRACLEDLAPIEFEDDSFLAPRDYDSYLSAVYGDYMKLPPEDQRENRHRIIEIDLGT